MGIKDLFKMVRDHAPAAMKTVDPATLLGSRVALDFNYGVHRMAKSRLVCGRAALEGFSFGAPPHVEAVADQMAAMSAMFGYSIWLVDNPQTTEAKRFEKARRQQASKRSTELRDGRVGAFKKLCTDVGDRGISTVSVAELGALGKEIGAAVETGQLTVDQGIQARTDELDRQQFQAGHIGSVMLREVRDALGRRGIDSAMAPAGIEAEQLGAMLQRTGQFDYVATDDTDTLVFGATELLCKYDGQTFQCVSLAGVLDGLELTFEQFVDFCIMCGCDFTERTLKGIGCKTALKLIKAHGSIERVLEEKQLSPEGFDFEEARGQFALDVRYEFLDADYLRPFLTEPVVPELVKGSTPEAELGDFLDDGLGKDERVDPAPGESSDCSIDTIKRETRDTDVGGVRGLPAVAVQLADAEAEGGDASCQH